MQLGKRGNRWWISGHKDGKKIRYSLGPDVSTQEEAETILKQVIAEQSALTIRNFKNDYLKDRRLHLSPKTLESYKDALNSFESFFGVHRSIESITSKEMSAWAADLLDGGRKPISVNVYLRSIKAAFNRAVYWDLIQKAPRIEMLKVPKHQPRHLSEQQFQAILDHETNPEYRRLWVFMVWTGVRRTEALTLGWEHVTLGERPQALVTGKGDKQRVIPLLPLAVAALGEPGASGLVFQVGHGDYVTHRFCHITRAAGMKAKLHDLRHTALTWMVARGVPLKLVQDIAGHTSITTTMGYAKTYAGDAYDTLMKAFNF